MVPKNATGLVHLISTEIYSLPVLGQVTQTSANAVAFCEYFAKGIWGADDRDDASTVFNVAV